MTAGDVPITPPQGHSSQPRAYCRACGQDIDARAVICPRCGVPQRQEVGSQSGRKDASVAVLLNFLWTGAGYFYVDSEKYMARGIICCVVTLFWFFANFLIFPIIFWLPYWIWGMVNANTVTKQHNAALDAR